MKNSVTTEPGNSKMPEDFASRLLAWYTEHARMMPWRVPPSGHAKGVRADPYHVWLSEVMLQQTRVVSVREYFLKFLDKWPTIQELANADPEDVLKAWAGLGYYSRARNLKKCADEIVSGYKGKFPETRDALKKLPGIGDYTAAAIAAIAFEEAVPVVDGNVERVIARHRSVDTPLPRAKSEITRIVEEVHDKKLPGEFAQAMMDLGATLCAPKRPSCPLCPVNTDCIAFNTGRQEFYPVKQPKPEKPTRKGAAFVMQNSTGKIFLCKRPPDGLLGGMTQVPTTNWNSRQDGETGVIAAPVKAEWKKAGIVRHTFTHFHLQLSVWSATNISTVAMEGFWCAPGKLQEEALPSLMRKAIALVPA